MTTLADIQRHLGVEPDGRLGPVTLAALAKALGMEKPARTLLDAPAFFKAVRTLTGPLNQVQVDTLNRLLETASHWPTGWLAYGLATAWHESGLEPIHEKGGRTYLAKYDTGKLAAALGNSPEADGDGIRYAGRGLVQLTGLRNYQRASEELGIALVADPDLALEPEHAVRILVWGMEGGKFTGKKLADYLPAERGTAQQFREARRIINGTDKAALIAGYAEHFQGALSQGGWGNA